MIRIGVVGYGYWGPNLVRNFSMIDGAEVARVSDLEAGRLAVAAKACPGARLSTDVDELLRDPEIDAVAIATPVSTHYSIGMQALAAGKHVLLEKPMAATSQECRRLIAEAERRERVLMVDHTFIYTGVVRKIRETIRSGALGDLLYYDSVRINLGLFQHDVNVLWDLAVHDLSIMDYVLDDTPVAVSATGSSHVAGAPEDVAFLTLFYDGPLIAHLHTNWLAPVKVRRTLIGGSERMIVYDDVDPDEKIKIYDKGIVVTEDPESIRKLRVSYRTGEVRIPTFDRTEALRTEALHFVECIRDGKTPITDGAMGLRVVNVLAAAEQSLAERGRMIEIEGSLEVAA
jgi:predicted dehydrogenase